MSKKEILDFVFYNINISCKQYNYILDKVNYYNKDEIYFYMYKIDKDNFKTIIEGNIPIFNILEELNKHINNIIETITGNYKIDN